MMQPNGIACGCFGDVMCEAAALGGRFNLSGLPFGTEDGIAVECDVPPTSRSFYWEASYKRIGVLSMAGQVHAAPE